MRFNVVGGVELEWVWSGVLRSHVRVEIELGRLEGLQDIFSVGRDNLHGQYDMHYCRMLAKWCSSSNA